MHRVACFHKEWSQEDPKGSHVYIEGQEEETGTTRHRREGGMVGGIRTNGR